MTTGLLTVLAAGLLTFVTPCVLPVVPIYLAALAGGDVRSLGSMSRGRLVMRAAFFALGFIAVFTVMGMGASSIGTLLSAHRAALQAGGAALVLVLALKFLGILRIPLLDRVARADDSRLQTRFGALQAVLMGVVFAAGWSPCVGPVLGTVLTYTASTTSSVALGALYLGTYGLGFALPLLLVAAFAEAGLSMLKRLRPHLARLERVTGVLLLVVGLSLGNDAIASWKEEGAVPAGPPAAALDKAVSVAGSPSMVELYAEGCPVCLRMEPLVQSLTDQCDEHGVRVQRIDVSKAENRRLVKQFRIVGVPTFLFLDERGQEVSRLVGEQSEATLREALSATRGVPCPGLGLLPADSTTATVAATPAKSCSPGES
jgi:cytochrome c-type biogenesis protein